MNNVNYCPHCGKENENQGKFCSHCGKEFSSIVKDENIKSVNDTNVYVNVESSEKTRAKSGAMTLLMYPLIFAMIIFCPLMPIAYITHDVLRFKKWNWIKEEGFSWKKKIIYYIIFCIVFYTTYIYIYVNKMYVAELFLGIGSVIFYMSYIDVGIGNPEKAKENENKSNEKLD